MAEIRGLPKFVFGANRLTLAVIEDFFAFLRDHREVEVSLDSHSELFASDIVPQLIAEAVKGKQ